MSSIKTIIANQINALKSTGPKPESLAITCANATKHGLFAKKLHVRQEDQAAFELFSRQMRAELAPEGSTETFLVDHFIDQGWRLRCCLKIETDLFEWYRNYQGEQGDIGIAFANDARQANCLSRLSRYAPIFERGLRKDLAELRKLKARRSRPSATSQESLSTAGSAAATEPSPPQDDKAATETSQGSNPGPRQTYLTPVGNLSKQVLLSDEDPGQFNAFVEGFFADWKPQQMIKAFLVELLAVTAWRLGRFSRLEVELFEQYRFYENKDGGALTAFVQDAVEMDCFAKLAECETRLRNGLSRILKDLLT